MSTGGRIVSGNLVRARNLRANTEWVHRKIIKEDGTKGYCADHRQETDPSCWKKASYDNRGRVVGPRGRKFAGGAPRVGHMHKPHMNVAFR